jgi:hypothetical protein
MDAITRSLLSATAFLLEWDALSKCEDENDLRTALMGAFLHAKETHLSLILLREKKPLKGFDKVLDLFLLPSWPPRGKAEAAGELKFFKRNIATDYRTRIGSRLSDLHYIHSLSADANPKLHGFFIDVALNPDLVKQKCYDSIKDMCKIAGKALYNENSPVPEDKLKDVKGIKAFANACLDRTPRKQRRQKDYGFIFPPMDLEGGIKPAKRGPAYIRSTKHNKDGLISIGVRKAGKEQTTPYRLLKGKNIAVCFAVFEPGGRLAANTDDLIENHERRKKSIQQMVLS